MAWDDDLDAASVLVPVDILNTPGALMSIKADDVEMPEDDSPAWWSGQTFMLGDRAHSAVTHRVYESLKDNNLGHDPTVDANRSTAAGSPTWWFDVGPTNKSAMFDGLVSTPTVAAAPMVIRIRPGAFNGFALFGIDATTYSVEVRSPPGGDLIYSEPETPLEGSMPGDYYEYFFGAFKPLTQLIRSGIDPYGSSEIILTLSKPSGEVKLGMFAIGDMRPLGIPQRDAVVEPIDYSYIKTDAYGNTEVKKRANATGMTMTAKLEIGDANNVMETIRQVLGVPCVVIGSQAPLYSWATVFGMVSARMSAPDYAYVDLNITVKGLI